MRLNRFGRTCHLLAILLPLAPYLTGCSTDMNGDESGQMMNSGMAQTRSGITKTQTGVTEFSAGAQQTAMSDMSSGIGMMNQGMTEMHNAVGMMSGTMMMNCTDGGIAMMEPMQQAMDQINQAQAKLADSDTTNDADGINQMNNGLTMMNSALDQAQTSINCMGHGHMM
jgi:uncharacterized phage infection (PIP) family protein YhgE